MKSLSSLAPDRSIVEASPTGSTAKRGRFKWQGKIMAKKKFLLTESSKSINNKIIFSYLQNNLEMEWIGYEGEFSVPVCLEIICVAESQNKFWDIIRWTTSWISNTPWASNGLKVRTWRHPNRRLSVYDQPGNQYVSRSCFVRYGSFQQIHCFRFLTCLDYFISGGWTKQALTVPTSSNTQI